MKYSDCKKELIEIYKKYNNENYFEIEYILKEILKDDNIFFIDITNKDFKKAKKIVNLRLKYNKPLQKIFKKAYFMNLEFFVNENVLTPRFDSEVIIDYLEKNKIKYKNVLDLCSGSGVLGICAKLLNKDCNLTLVDISRKALKVSKINARKHNINAKFIKSDMFKKVNNKFDLIICNPPYIETETVKNLSYEVKNYDPKISLDGGIDGLKFYNILFEELDKFLNKNGICLMEIGYNQGHLINKFKTKYKNVELIKDLNGLDRVIKIEKEYVC